MQSFDDVLLLHVCSSLAKAINAQRRIVLGYLTCLDLRQRVDGRQTGILGKCQRNGLERVGKRPERILLQSFDLKRDRPDIISSPCMK